MVGENERTTVAQAGRVYAKGVGRSVYPYTYGHSKWAHNQPLSLSLSQFELFRALLNLKDVSCIPIQEGGGSQQLRVVTNSSVFLYLR